MPWRLNCLWKTAMQKGYWDQQPSSHIAAPTGLIYFPATELGKWSLQAVQFVSPPNVRIISRMILHLILHLPGRQGSSVEESHSILPHPVHGLCSASAPREGNGKCGRWWQWDWDKRGRLKKVPVDEGHGVTAPVWREFPSCTRVVLASFLGPSGVQVKCENNYPQMRYLVLKITYFLAVRKYLKENIFLKANIYQSFRIFCIS